MNDSVNIIPFSNLALAFFPVLAVVIISYKWDQGCRNTLYAVSRMLVQLLLIGYFLAYIFESRNAWVVLLVLAVMVFISSWIALRTIKNRRRQLYSKALLSIILGGGATLILVTQGVLNLDPWYRPDYFIPLAGMIFANAMNSVSLAADRLDAELGRGVAYESARNIAFRASLIPIINSLFAVGLVSLPGMMTGQILSGISPLIAARYQIMVMCMVFGAAGIASAFFLTVVRSDFVTLKNQQP
ncbi:MAG: ABC transporter permease [Proteobacteria bacterium]|nr:ABC transporter permease [Pseudomonadota bacterium]MBU1710805.1 ABC transporter permease [Pseudomonadota bacterium]